MSPDAAPTAGQTVGPFFGFSLPYDGGPDLVPPTHAEAVRLHGTVFDGAGAPVPDALIEIWQAGPDGRPVREPGSLRRDGVTFTGWGRAATDADGHYAFRTLLPAAAEGRTPYVAVTVFARGLLDRLFTRAYLPGPDQNGAADPLLAALPDERRTTLLARPDEGGFRFDIVLQGEGETVFLHHRTP